MPSIKTFSLLLVSFILLQCTPSIEPIQYGKHQCHSCKMNIVDKVHAAQYVTKKGRNYMFDAIECMVQDVSLQDESQMHIILVSDYTNPGEMTDAVKAIYLVSPNIKSPMGEFLSAFSNRSQAEQTLKENDGKLYDWDGIKAHIKVSFK